MTTSTLVKTIQDPVLTLRNVAQNPNSTIMPRSLPLPAKLSEGWHYTERWGEVFVAPGGSAWVVQQNGQRLINVTVSLNPSDIIQRPLLERRKQAIAKQSYRKRRDKRTSKPNLPLSEATIVNK